MANENSIVEVGIQTKVTGEKKVATYTENIERLDKVTLNNLKKAESNISAIESKLKAAADQAERFNKAMGNNAGGRGGSASADKQAQAAAKAEIAAQRVAAAQQKAANIAKQTAAQTEAANNKAAATAKNASAQVIQANTRVEAAQKRAAISSQNLASAQSRADQSQKRAAVSAQNLATAQTRAEQAQARAAIVAQRIENAQIRVRIQTDNLNKKLNDSTGWGNFHKQIDSANRKIGQFGQNLSSAGGSLTATVTTSIAGLAYLSVNSAKDLDTYRNRLTVFEGSVEGAEAKIENLRKLALESAGVTTSAALDSYSQLAAIGEIGEEAINKQIKALGKLNSAFSIPDAKEYNRNMVQIFQQDFEGQDIKQALGVNPLFERILEEAFNTSDPEKLKKLKASGKLTLDSFIDGMAEATLNNPKLKGLGDSVGVRMQKTMERVKFAFAPLGEAIISAIEPLIPYIVAFIEYISKGFASLSPYVQTLIVIFGAVAAAAGPFLVLLGGIISGGSAVVTFLSGLAGGFSAIGAAIVSAGGFISSFITLIGTSGLTASLTGLVSVLGGGLVAAVTAAAIALGKIILGIAAVVAVVAAAGAAIAAVVYLVYRIWQQNIGGIQTKTVAVFNAVKNFIVSTFNQIRKVFEQVLPQLETLTGNILKRIQEFWDLHGENILEIIKVAWNLFKTIVTEGINYIANVIKLTLAIINGDWKSAGEAAAQILDSTWRIFLTIVGAGARMIVEVIQWLWRQIFYTFERIKNAAIELGTRFINSFIETIKGSPAQLGNAIAFLIDEGVSGAIGAVYNAGQRLWSYLRDGFYGGAMNNPVVSPDGTAVTGAFAGAGANLTPKGGGGKSGGKKKKEKKPNFEPIDAAWRAEAEAAREDQRFFNRVNTENIERARAMTRFFGEEYAERLQLGRKAVTDYFKELRDQRLKDFDLEIAALEESRKRAELILSKMPIKGDEDNIRQRDKARAEIITLEADIQRKTDERAYSQITTYREELDAILEIVEANKELYKTYLDLNNETRKSEQFSIDEEFNKRFEQNREDLVAARQALKAAELDPVNNSSLIERYKLLVETLTKNAEYMESIKNQRELQADFNENQRQLNLIFDDRQKKLDDLERSLTETGADEDKATAARKAAMKEYETQIDAVINRLEFLSTALKNPEAKKALDELKKQRADERSTPFAERLRGVQMPFEATLRARDRRLTENDLSGDSEFLKEQRRLAILRETTAELLKQADAYVALARESGNPQIIADAEAQRDAIRQNALEVQSYGKQLKNVAIDAFANGLNNFFNDLASGAVSATDAILNFVGSFVQAIQQMITQILAYMAVAMILKALGIPVPAGIASGGGIGGKKDGGSARSLPVVLPFAGNFATGGSPLNHYAGGILIGSGGLINGAGGPRTDSIPTYFPAAKRFGNTSNTEFILDAETTANIGVDNLNRLLATKGKGGGDLFGRLRNRSGNFADGGAASESVLSGMKGFETPQLGASENLLEMTNINYFGKKPIEEVVEEMAQSSKGDRTFVNQFDRNISKIKAKLGIKGK